MTHTSTPLTLVLHFDGACWPNPGGTPTYGWHLDTTDGERIADASGTAPGLPVEQRTNNTAEFCGLIAGLKWLASVRFAAIDVLTIHGDSQLVVEIAAGRRRAKKPHLQHLSDECRAILARLDVGDIVLEWVPRERNRVADVLSKAH